MPSWQEVLRSLQGAWLLARRDVAGYRYFNLTIEGFWRSFAAVLFIAPVFFLIETLEFNALSAERAENGAAPDIAGFYLRRTVLLALSWASFPLVMVLIARLFGVARGYVTFIIAFNWSSVLAEPMMMAPVLLYYMGLIGKTPTAGLSWVCFVLVVLYRWFVARTALETSGLVAGAVVLLEFTLAIAIARLGMVLFG